MEQIVCGIAKINFQQQRTFQEDLSYNNSTQQKDNCIQLQSINVNMTSVINADAPTSIIETDGGEESSSESDNVADSQDPNETTDGEIKTFQQRRNLPKRASKDNFLQKIKRRTISKPAKRTNRALEFGKLRPTEIKRIYTNQKLTNFRPSNLETIFEEPNTEHESGADDIEDIALNIDVNQVRFVGAKKMKRSISCCDGLNINKTLLKKRRAKIKKSFGRRFALKKIPLNDFLERLNKSIECENNEIVQGNEQLREQSADSVQLLQKPMLNMINQFELMDEDDTEGNI